MIRPLLHGQTPLMNQACEPVFDIHDPAIAQICTDLWDTLMACPHHWGLSAPQIGHPLRIMAFGRADAKNHAMTAFAQIPPTLLINPSWDPLDVFLDAQWETCLSLPGQRALVLRSKNIVYSGFNVHGKRIVRHAKDLHARLFCHEYDHLDGVLITERGHLVRSKDALQTAGASLWQSTNPLLQSNS